MMSEGQAMCGHM